MRLSSGVLLFGLGVSAILACSSSTPEAQAPEAEPPAEGAAGADTAAAPTPLPDVWDEKNMTKDQQIAFMKERVMPAMAPVFKEHDPKAFEKFGCEIDRGPMTGHAVRRAVDRKGPEAVASCTQGSHSTVLSAGCSVLSAEC